MYFSCMMNAYTCIQTCIYAYAFVYVWKHVDTYTHDHVPVFYPEFLTFA